MTFRCHAVATEPRRPAALAWQARQGDSAQYEPESWYKGTVPGGSDTEELLIVGTTVYYTVGKRLKRKFDFAAERQKVLKAVFAWFEPDDAGLHITEHATAELGGSTRARPWAQSDALKSVAVLPRKVGITASTQTLERALVVFLEELAHVFYDDGRRKVINVPFRISDAAALDRGILLRRDTRDVVETDLEARSRQAMLFHLRHPTEEIGLCAMHSREKRTLGADDTLLVATSWLVVTCAQRAQTISLWRMTPARHIEQQHGGSSTAPRHPPGRRRASTRFSSATSDLLHEEKRETRRSTLSRSEIFGSNVDRIIFSDLDSSELQPESFRTDYVLEHIDSLPVECSDTLPACTIVQSRAGEIELAILVPQAQQALHFTVTSHGKPKSMVGKIARFAASQLERVAIGSIGFLLVVSPTGQVHLRHVSGLQAEVTTAAPTSPTRRSDADTTNVSTGSEHKGLRFVLPAMTVTNQLLSALSRVLDATQWATLVFATLDLLSRDQAMSEVEALTAAVLAGFTPSSGSLPPNPPTAELGDAAARIVFSATLLAHRNDMRALQPQCPQLFFALHFLSQDLALDSHTVAQSRALLLPLAQIAQWFGWNGYVKLFLGDLAIPGLRLESAAPHFRFTEPQDSPPMVVDWIRDSSEGKTVARQTFESLFAEPSARRRLGGPKLDEVLCRNSELVYQLFDHLRRGDLSGLRAYVGRTLGARLLLPRLPVAISLPLREALQCLGHDSANLEASTKTTARRARSGIDTAAQGEDRIAINELTAEPQGVVSASLERPVAEPDHPKVTRLIFPHDQRVQEASKMLLCHATQLVRHEFGRDLGDEKLLREQQSKARLISRRVLATPTGRALYTYSCKSPLPTERFAIRELNFDVKFMPAAVTVAEDKSFLTPEAKTWALFHSGVAAGVSIPRDNDDISASWIVFNKPDQLDETHAGLLLGLGLNGHLKTMATWHAFNYLTSKHTMTSIGLLLGLSATFLGTMEPMVTKLLSVHVLALLPPASNELNLGCFTQTAGVVGIGLLYQGSSHRRMSEVMLREIVDDDHSPDHFRSESYRLGAGIALGLINLAQGHSLVSLNDLSLVERLDGCVRGVSREKHDLDQKIPGAIVALGLVFMKSGSQQIAAKLRAPDNHFALDRLRPSLWLLMTLCRSLILWDEIQPTTDFVMSCVPSCLQVSPWLSSKRLDSDDMTLQSIIAGACMSIGFKFAGTLDLQARDTILHYLDRFIDSATLLSAGSFDKKMAKTCVSNCAANLALAASCIMSGSGDIPVMRRLRKLHMRLDPDTSYGESMAVQQATGVLFIGGGRYALSNSPLAVACLLASFYPVLPSTVTDNAGHLQALRHLWTLAVELRCLTPIDAGTGAECACDVVLRFKDTARQSQRLAAPCLLPLLGTIASISCLSKRHHPTAIDMGTDNPAKRALLASLRVELRPLAREEDIVETVILNHAMPVGEDEADGKLLGGSASHGPDAANRLAESVADEVHACLAAAHGPQTQPEAGALTDNAAIEALASPKVVRDAVLTMLRNESTDAGPSAPSTTGGGSGGIDSGNTAVDANALDGVFAQSIEADILSLRLLLQRVLVDPGRHAPPVRELKLLAAYWRATTTGHLRHLFPHDAAADDDDEDGRSMSSRDGHSDGDGMTDVDDGDGDGDRTPRSHAPLHAGSDIGGGGGSSGGGVGKQQARLLDAELMDLVDLAIWRIDKGLS